MGSSLDARAWLLVIRAAGMRSYEWPDIAAEASDLLREVIRTAQAAGDAPSTRPPGNGASPEPTREH